MQADQGQRQRHTGHQHGGEPEPHVRVRQRQRGRPEERDAGGERAHLADPTQHGGRDQTADQSADALHGDQHPDERRVPAQTLIDVREDERLGEAHHQRAEPVADKCPPDRRLADEVTQTRDEPDPPAPGDRAVLGRVLSRLGEGQSAHHDGGDQEPDSPDGGQHAATDQRVEPGTGQRADQPQALAHRLEHPVGLTEQVGGDEFPDQSTEHHADREVRQAVERGHPVDDPHVARVAHREERGEQHRHGEVGDHEDPTPWVPVDDPADQWCEHPRGDDHEDDGAGEGVRSGQVLHPDGECQQQHRLGDHAGQQSAEEQAEVRASQDGAH